MHRHYKVAVATNIVINISAKLQSCDKYLSRYLIMHRHYKVAGVAQIWTWILQWTVRMKFSVRIFNIYRCGWSKLFYLEDSRGQNHCLAEALPSCWLCPLPSGYTVPLTTDQLHKK